MAEDITSLQIKILYDSVEQAERRLRDLEGTGDKAAKGMKKQEGAAASLMKTIGKLALTYISVTSAINGFKAVIQTTREFQVLRAAVQTATGSMENMNKAWGALQDFAVQTPFGIEESVKAFISLINYGLTPSERSLRAFGDMASAMTYTLQDMTEAVAKATAGEFEPLRKFAITAKRDGDQVTFAFRGVKTTVENTTDAIQEYFTKLGEDNYTGAMAERMKTLDGRFANLEDAWEVFKYDLGTSTGAAEAFGGVLTYLADRVENLSAYLNSGEFALDFESWSIGFEGYVEDIEAGFSYINGLMQEHGESGETTGMTVAEGLIGGIKAVVSGYRAYVKSMATILWGLVDSAVQVGKAIYQTIAASFGALIGAASRAGAAIGNALNPFSGKSAGKGFQEAWDGVSAEISGAADDTRKAWDQSFAKIGINADTVAFNIKDAWAEAGDEINQAAMLSAEADQKRKDYDKGAADRAKDRSDRLAEFRAKNAGGGLGGGGGSPTGGKGGKGGGAGSAEESEWKTLEESLRKQETLISESFQRRFDLIEKNTREGSAYQAELEISLTDQFEEEQRKRLDKLKDAPETLFSAFAEEERIIEESYAKRKEIILSATELTEREKLKMLQEAELQYTSSMRKYEIERNKVALGLAADFMGNISAIAGAFGKRGAKIAKAAAIAETTVKTYQSATAAYASLAGIPYVGPALGAAAAGAAIAAGLANIQKIKSTDSSGGYSGAYAIGGLIPSGSFGLVGEAGPELVRGPAMVTSAQSTKDRGYAGGGGGNNVDIKIINMSGEPVKETRRQDGNKEMIEFIIGQAREAVANDISKGGTKVARAMEGTYNMTRGKRA